MGNPLELIKTLLTPTKVPLIGAGIGLGTSMAGIRGTDTPETVGLKGALGASTGAVSALGGAALAGAVIRANKNLDRVNRRMQEYLKWQKVPGPAQWKGYRLLRALSRLRLSDKSIGASALAGIVGLPALMGIMSGDATVKSALPPVQPTVEEEIGAANPDFLSTLQEEQS